MKFKEIFYLFGLKPAARSFGHEVVTFNLAQDGPVQYARWLHPKEQRRLITQEGVTNLRKFLKPGDVAIDIGGHTGDTALPLALAVGGTGCVLAFEPNPYVFEILKKNSELNPGKARIIPVPLAATAQAGEFEFEYSDAGFGNGGLHQGISKWRHAHAFKLKVRGEHLPTYLAQHHADLIPRVRMIKVDAEGYDIEILKSMRDFIAERRPFIRIEVYKWLPAEKRTAIHEFFTGLRYEPRLLVSDNYEIGEVVRPEDMHANRHFDIFAVPQ